MIDKFLKTFVWLLGIFIIANLLILDFVWVSEKKKEKAISLSKTVVSVTPTPAFQPTPEVSPTGTDCSSCQQLIAEEVAKAVSSAPLSVSKATPTPSGSGQKVIYMSIGSSGSTSNMVWSDIPGTDFYFDLADYSSAKSVRWEASLQSYVSSDPVYARLYDVTNKRGVDGSDLTTRSSSFEYIRSSDLTIWRGNNLYRIQARGSSGNTVNISAPRLKIILE